MRRWRGVDHANHMHGLPPVKPGTIRIGVSLPGREMTPGEVASACGVDLDGVGMVHVEPGEAVVEIRHDLARVARNNLDRVGPTRILAFSWQWLRLNVGRNHGLTLGQLKKLCQQADALPLGKYQMNNTHCMVGIHDHKGAAVLAKLEAVRINGFAVRPELLPVGTGPGSPAFVPKTFGS